MSRRTTDDILVSAMLKETSAAMQQSKDAIERLLVERRELQVERDQLKDELAEARADLQMLREVKALGDAAVEHAAAWRIEAIRQVLREVEWRGTVSLTYPCTLVPSCPYCSQQHATGHDADCRLAAALTQTEQTTMQEGTDGV